MDMKTYTIDPERRAGLVRAFMLRLALISIAIIVAVVAFAIIFLVQMNSAVTTTNIIVMGAAVLVLAGVVAFRSYNQVRAYEQGLTSIQVSIGSERVDKQQSGSPSVRIGRTDATTLIETESGVLVMTRDKAKFLWVPSQLLGYADARAALERWMPIRQLPPRKSMTARLLTVAWGVGTALCVGVLLLATNPWQALVAGAATMAIYIFVYRLLRAQKNLDLKFRRTYSGILMFLIIVVAIKLLMTLGPIVMTK